MVSDANAFSTRAVAVAAIISHGIEGTMTYRPRIKRANRASVFKSMALEV
jgi:hypothetical protein